MLGPGRWRGRWDARPRHTPEATARTGLARPPGTVAFWPAARHGRQNGRCSVKSQLRNQAGTGLLRGGLRRQRRWGAGGTGAASGRQRGPAERTAAWRELGVVRCLSLLPQRVTPGP